MSIIAPKLVQPAYTPANTLKFDLVNDAETAITRFMLADKAGTFNPSAMKWNTSTLDAALGKETPQSVADGIVWSICAYFYGQFNMSQVDSLSAKWFAQAFKAVVGGIKPTNSMDQQRLEQFAPMIARAILAQKRPPKAQKPVAPVVAEAPAPNGENAVPMVSMPGAKAAARARAAVKAAGIIRKLRAEVRSLKAQIAAPAHAKPRQSRQFRKTGTTG